jgi:hypothetical protein
MSTHQPTSAEKPTNPAAPAPNEAEYETSPDAPYNGATERHLGSSANDPPRDREDEIERTKQYYHGGKRPQS